MYKILITSGLLFLAMIGVSFSQSFTLVYDSDPGDYIGQGEYWSFDDSVDFISTQKTYENPKNAGYTFEIQGFDINTQFTFEPASKIYSPGMYYPAKNFPSEKFNGMDLSADHRGCNQILGGFYVHEFEISGDNVSKAAIDFVQFCEAGPSGLYGSLRLNSAVPSSCSTTGCPDVRKRFNPAGENAEIKVEHVSLDSIVEKLDAIQEKIKTEYSYFYTECIEPIENGGSEPLVEEYSTDYFNTNACQGKYTNIFSLVNNLLNKFIGKRNVGGGDVLLNKNIKKEAILVSQKMIAKIDVARSRLSNAGALTSDLEIALSSIAFILEMGIFGLEISK